MSRGKPTDERWKKAEERLMKAARSILTPADIIGRLSQYIIGQDEAVRAAAVALYQQVQFRVRRVASDMPFITPVRIPPLLLMGPTGCGKSTLLKALGWLSGLPALRADASQLTAQGYVGSSVDDWLRLLLAMSDGYVPLAQVGIVMIDELDKKAGARGEGTRMTRDVYSGEAQDGLLRLLEGGMIALEMVDTTPTGQRRYQVPIMCDNLLTLAAGAFDGIEDVVAKRLRGKRRAGFGAATGVAPEAMTPTQLRRAVTAVDLIGYGLKPEIVGRLGRVVVMPELGRTSMRRILSDVNDGPVKSAQDLALKAGFKFEFSGRLLDSIVDQAMESGLGVRALHATVARITERAWVEVPEIMRDEKTYPRGRVIVHLRTDAIKTGSYRITVAERWFALDDTRRERERRERERREREAAAATAAASGATGRVG